jgi:hypothetical protein
MTFLPSCDGAGCSAGMRTTHRISFQHRVCMTLGAPLAHSISGVTQTAAPAPSRPVTWRAEGSRPINGRRRCAFTRVARGPKMTQAILFHRCRRWWRLLSTSSAARWPCIAPTCGRTAPARLQLEKPKAKFGPVAGGAVRFEMPRAGEPFAVAEGIETALSVAAACSMPAMGRAFGRRDQKPRSAARGDACRYLCRLRRKWRRRACRARCRRAVDCRGPPRARCNAA